MEQPCKADDPCTQRHTVNKIVNRGTLSDSQETCGDMACRMAFEERQRDIDAFAQVGNDSTLSPTTGELEEVSLFTSHFNSSSTVVKAVIDGYWAAAKVKESAKSRPVLLNSWSFDDVCLASVQSTQSPTNSPALSPPIPEPVWDHEVPQDVLSDDRSNSEPKSTLCSGNECGLPKIVRECGSTGLSVEPLKADYAKVTGQSLDPSKIEALLDEVSCVLVTRNSAAGGAWEQNLEAVQRGFEGEQLWCRWETVRRKILELASEFAVVPGRKGEPTFSRLLKVVGQLLSQDVAPMTDLHSVSLLEELVSDVTGEGGCHEGSPKLRLSVGATIPVNSDADKGVVCRVGAEHSGAGFSSYPSFLVEASKLARSGCRSQPQMLSRSMVKEAPCSQSTDMPGPSLSIAGSSTPPLCQELPPSPEVAPPLFTCYLKAPHTSDSLFGSRRFLDGEIEKDSAATGGVPQLPIRDSSQQPRRGIVKNHSVCQNSDRTESYAQVNATTWAPLAYCSRPSALPGDGVPFFHKSRLQVLGMLYEVIFYGCEAQARVWQKGEDLIELEEEIAEDASQEEARKASAMQNSGGREAAMRSPVFKMTTTGTARNENEAKEREPSLVSGKQQNAEHATFEDKCARRRLKKKEKRDKKKRKKAKLRELKRQNLEMTSCLAGARTSIEDQDSASFPDDGEAEVDEEGDGIRFVGSESAISGCEKTDDELRTESAAGRRVLATSKSKVPLLSGKRLGSKTSFVTVSIDPAELNSRRQMFRNRAVGILASSVKTEWARRFGTSHSLAAYMRFFGVKKLKSLLCEVPNLIITGAGGFMRVTTVEHAQRHCSPYPPVGISSRPDVPATQFTPASSISCFTAAHYSQARNDSQNGHDTQLLCSVLEQDSCRCAVPLPVGCGTGSREWGDPYLEDMANGATRTPKWQQNTSNELVRQGVGGSSSDCWHQGFDQSWVTEESPAGQQRCALDLCRDLLGARRCWGLRASAENMVAPDSSTTGISILQRRETEEETLPSLRGFADNNAHPPSVEGYRQLLGKLIEILVETVCQEQRDTFLSTRQTTDTAMAAYDIYRFHASDPSREKSRVQFPLLPEDSFHKHLKKTLSSGNRTSTMTNVRKDWPESSSARQGVWGLPLADFRAEWVRVFGTPIDESLRICNFETLGAAIEELTPGLQLLGSDGPSYRLVTARVPARHPVAGAGREEQDVDEASTHEAEVPELPASYAAVLRRNLGKSLEQNSSQTKETRGLKAQGQAHVFFSPGNRRARVSDVSFSWPSLPMGRRVPPTSTPTIGDGGCESLQSSSISGETDTSLLVLQLSELGSSSRDSTLQHAEPLGSCAVQQQQRQQQLGDLVEGDDDDDDNEWGEGQEDCEGIRVDTGFAAALTPALFHHTAAPDHLRRTTTTTTTLRSGEKSRWEFGNGESMEWFVRHYQQGQQQQQHYGSHHQHGQNQQQQPFPTSTCREEEAEKGEESLAAGLYPLNNLVADLDLKLPSGAPSTHISCSSNTSGDCGSLLSDSTSTGGELPSPSCSAVSYSRTSPTSPIKSPLSQPASPPRASPPTTTQAISLFANDWQSPSLATLEWGVIWCSGSEEKEAKGVDGEAAILTPTSFWSE